MTHDERILALKQLVAQEKRRQQRRVDIGIVLTCVVIFALLIGCATAPLKDRLVKSVQSAHVAAANAQDAEMKLFGENLRREAEKLPPLVPELTAEAHKAFHAALVPYWDAEIKIADALKRWDPATQPVPIDLKTGLAEAANALAKLRPLVPAGAQTVIDYMQAAIAAMQLSIELSETNEPVPAPAPVPLKPGGGA